MTTSLDASTLPLLARGTAVLGAGGGGDPKVGLVVALQSVEDHGAVPLLDVADLDPEGLVMPCGMIGAPTVHIEKYVNGDEGNRLREHLESLWGRPVVALMCAEIGGSNGLLPVAWAARLGLPLADADGMGRAFPLVPQLSMNIAGIPACPSVMTDERGNVIVFRSVSGEWLERMARAAVVEFGGAGSATEYAMTADQAKRATVLHTVSLALGIGAAIESAAKDPVETLIDYLGAFRLIGGKVLDVERHTSKGFVRGSVVLQGLDLDEGRFVRLEIQNENLVALEGGKLLASVPDLITLLDSESADAVVTERIRYGQKVTAIAFPCNPLWRTPAGLELAGPRAFGYDFDYVRVEDIANARG